MPTIFNKIKTIARLDDPDPALMALSQDELKTRYYAAAKKLKEASEHFMKVAEETRDVHTKTAVKEHNAAMKARGRAQTALDKIGRAIRAKLAQNKTHSKVKSMTFFKKLKANGNVTVASGAKRAWTAKRAFMAAKRAFTAEEVAGAIKNMGVPTKAGRQKLADGFAKVYAELDSHFDRLSFYYNADALDLKYFSSPMAKAAAQLYRFNESQRKLRADKRVAAKGAAAKRV